MNERNSEFVVAIDRENGSKVVARGEGQPGKPFTLKLPGARLWTPDSPTLYQLNIDLYRDRVATNRTFDPATGAETTTSANAFSTQLFGNGNVVLSPGDRWTLELPLAENPWFMSVSPTDIAEFDGGELADAILSLEFLSTQ